MHEHPQSLRTIQEVITYLREVLALRPEYMREKDQEHIAGYIVGIGGNDQVDIWHDAYPDTFTEILALASDLEWSNVANTTIAWRRIKELVNELEQEVETKKK